MPTVPDRSVNRSGWNAVLFLVAVSVVAGLILAAGELLRLRRDTPLRLGRASLVVRIGQGGEALADPETGLLVMRSADGSVIDFGAGHGSVPEWIPSVPGYPAKNVFSMRDNAGGGSVGFVVGEAVEPVCAAFPADLKKRGMRVSVLPANQQNGCMLLAQDSEKKLVAVLSIGSSPAGTTVNVTYTKK